MSVEYPTVVIHRSPNLAVGVRVFGPFKNRETADLWAKGRRLEDVEVYKLESWAVANEIRGTLEQSWHDPVKAES